MSARILVVDDAATVRLYHRKLLAGAGWQTVLATNGVEAIEAVTALAEDEAFDLYVVDVNMPKMDGYRFVRALRAMDLRHQAPVVMVSTEAELSDQSQARSAGANAYLVKPATAGDLVATAALLLGDAVAAQALAASLAAAGGARPAPAATPADLPVTEAAR